MPGGSTYDVVYPAGIDYLNGPVQGAKDINEHLAAQVAACRANVSFSAATPRVRWRFSPL
ncbi:MAG: hypothetical protein ACQSGP_30385 [Frankia sp.]